MVSEIFVREKRVNLNGACTHPEKSNAMNLWRMMKKMKVKQSAH